MKDPAFPYTESNTRQYPGLTKREYFAAIAMQSILSNPNIARSLDAIECNYDDISRVACNSADALIKSLNF